MSPNPNPKPINFLQLNIVSRDRIKLVEIASKIHFSSDLIEILPTDALFHLISNRYMKIYLCVDFFVNERYYIKSFRDLLTVSLPLVESQEKYGLDGPWIKNLFQSFDRFVQIHSDIQNIQFTYFPKEILPNFDSMINIITKDHQNPFLNETNTNETVNFDKLNPLIHDMLIQWSPDLSLFALAFVKYLKALFHSGIAKYSLQLSTLVSNISYLRQKQSNLNTFLKTLESNGFNLLSAFSLPLKRFDMYQTCFEQLLSCSSELDRDYSLLQTCCQFSKLFNRNFQLILEESIHKSQLNALFLRFVHPRPVFLIDNPRRICFGTLQCQYYSIDPSHIHFIDIASQLGNNTFSLESLSLSPCLIGVCNDCFFVADIVSDSSVSNPVSNTLSENNHSTSWTSTNQSSNQSSNNTNISSDLNMKLENPQYIDFTQFQRIKLPNSLGFIVKHPPRLYFFKTPTGGFQINVGGKKHDFGKYLEKVVPDQLHKPTLNLSTVGPILDKWIQNSTIIVGRQPTTIISLDLVKHYTFSIPFAEPVWYNFTTHKTCKQILVSCQSPGGIQMYIGTKIPEWKWGAPSATLGTFDVQVVHSSKKKTITKLKVEPNTKYYIMIRNFSGIIDAGLKWVGLRSAPKIQVNLLISEPEIVSGTFEEQTNKVSEEKVMIHVKLDQNTTSWKLENKTLGWGLEPLLIKIDWEEPPDIFYVKTLSITIIETVEFSFLETIVRGQFPPQEFDYDYLIPRTPFENNQRIMNATLDTPPHISFYLSLIQYGQTSNCCIEIKTEWAKVVGGYIAPNPFSTLNYSSKSPKVVSTVSMVSPSKDPETKDIVQALEDIYDAF